jgi:hypothetical protein
MLPINTKTKIKTSLFLKDRDKRNNISSITGAIQAEYSRSMYLSGKRVEESTVLSSIPQEFKIKSSINSTIKNEKAKKNDKTPNLTRLIILPFKLKFSKSLPE